MKTILMLLAAALVVAAISLVATGGPSDIAHLIAYFEPGTTLAAPLIVALRQKQHDLKQEATALCDAADKDNDGVLTEEQEKRFVEIEAELETVAADIQKQEDSAARRQRLDAIVTQPGSTAPTVPAGQSVITNEPDPATTYGFRNLGEFATAVHRASDRAAPVMDPRLSAAPTNYHEGGGTSGEGFMLPVAFRDEIWEAVSGTESLLQDVDLEPTTARQVDMIKDESTPWGSAGVQAYWRAEGAQMTASRLDTDGASVTLHELYAFVLATEELLMDAPRLNARLMRKAPQAIAWKASDAIVHGNGAGKPLGWMESGALVTVAKESGQSADTIDAQNVLKMFSRLMTVPGDRPYWLTNQDTVPQLAAMTIGDQPVWMPPNGLIDAPGGFLLGRAVKFSEHAKTLGDKGDITLVSPKGYYAARRTQGIEMAESIHLFFDYNIKAFRFIFRFGGQPHLSAPVSPANGSSTRSHFVTLAERA